MNLQTLSCKIKSVDRMLMRDSGQSGSPSSTPEDGGGGTGAGVSANGDGSGFAAFAHLCAGPADVPADSVELPRFAAYASSEDLTSGDSAWRASFLIDAQIGSSYSTMCARTALGQQTMQLAPPLGSPDLLIY